ncbi:MAG: gamma-glutamyl-gamma-aminobutyrate hydrolase family protein [Planctomycetes bacterium]|nr:gamma-glutamyl-gamma-aminobutyrate hydrolase family protein [Planctomycetota bacterium]
MRKPLIGLNCRLVVEEADTYYKLDRHYPRAIEKAGGVPFILPFVRSPEEASEWLDRVDAVAFTGGPDIDPCRWGEPPHPEAQLMHPEKEESDFLYAAEALRRDIPVLGICLGSQLLNVALGGSLHQHIGEHHRNARHGVEVGASRTREVLGMARPQVNSSHHQAVHRVGAGLRVTAMSPDGVIEGTESEKHRFVVAVQWHPERIADQPEQLALFQALVRQTNR